MDDLYPALRNPEPKRASRFQRAIEAAIKIWNESDESKQIDEKAVPPTRYLGEAEKFLDQFLLSYFYPIIICPNYPPINPWKAMCDLNPWLSRMPELWLKTGEGCMLTKAQLDYVAALLHQRVKG